MAAEHTHTEREWLKGALRQDKSSLLCGIRQHWESEKKYVVLKWMHDYSRLKIYDQGFFGCLTSRAVMAQVVLNKKTEKSESKGAGVF